MPANMKGTKTTPLKGSKVTPLKGIKVTPLKGTKVTPLKGTQVTPMKGTKVITMVTPKVTTLTSAALLRFLRRHDQKIPDGDDLRVRECMGEIRECERGDELDGRVVAIFDSVVSAGSDKSEAAFLAAALCAAVYGADRTVVGGSSSLSAEVIPDRSDADFEPALRTILGRMRSLGNALDLSVEAGGVAFSDFLRRLSSYLLDNGLSVPVTAEAVECAEILLQIAPSAVERDIGKMCAAALFNVDGVDPDGLFSAVVDVYSKLRQVPKLVARILLAVKGSSGAFEVRELSEHCKSHLGRAVGRLPTGQVFDLWKTILFHIADDSQDDNLLLLVDQVASVFLRNAAVCEHSLPQSAKDRATDMMVKTSEALSPSSESGQKIKSESGKKLSRARRDLAELAEVFAHYRGETEELKGITMKGLDVADVGGQDLEHLMEDTKKFPKLLRGLKPKEVEENRKLQRGIVLNACHFAAEVLDVEGGGVSEAAAKLIARYAASEDKACACKCSGACLRCKCPKCACARCRALKKAMAAAEAAMAGERANPELDAKFYLLPPIEAFELLPLESVEPSLNLCVLALAAVLLSLSPDDDANARLAAVLARSLDRMGDCLLLRHVDGARMLLWVAERGRRLDCIIVEGIERCLARGIVKFMHEQGELHRHFGANMKRVAAAMAADSVHSQAAAVVLLEELERPLAFRDASKEKLEWCDRYFDMLVNDVKSKSHDGGVKNRDLLMRAVSAVVSVLYNRPTSEADKYAPWRAAVQSSLDHALSSPPSPHTRRFLKNVVAAWDSLGLKGDGGKGGLRRIWQRITTPDQNHGDTKRADDFDVGFVEVLADVIDAMDASEAEEAMGEIVCRTISACAEEGEERGTGSGGGGGGVWYVQLWGRIAAADISTDENRNPVRNAFEEVFPHFHKMQLREALGRNRDLDFTAYVLRLEAAILERDKPIMFPESEARCLMTSLALDLTKVAPSDSFIALWKAVYRVLSAAFLKRANSLVLSRIPNVLAVFRVLLRGLVSHCDQRVKHSPSDLKELLLCSHNLDRLCDQFRRHREDFARVAPYAVADILRCFQDFPPPHPAVKANLLSAVRKLLDICDRHSKDLLATNLPDGEKEVYRQTLDDYNKHYKYTGKV